MLGRSLDGVWHAFLVLLVLSLARASCLEVQMMERMEKNKQATATAGAQEAPEATPDKPVTGPSTEKPLPMQDPEETVVFSYDGENQSYHTGLRNQTVFYIDYDTGLVIAQEEATFEEPAGSQVRRGVDKVEFTGTYVGDTQSIAGDLTIYTTGTATGGESSANTVTYTMSGMLVASYENGQWVGTVTGASTLTQQWEGKELADVLAESNVEWTITSITNEKIP